MYMQEATPRPAEPRRFGMEVFKQRNSRQSNDSDGSARPGPGLRGGAGRHGIAIDLWGGVSRRLIRTVDREGRVSLPEVGPVLVSGKSLSDVQNSIQTLLRSQLRDVSADVSLARLRTIRVYESWRCHASRCLRYPVLFRRHRRMRCSSRMDLLRVDLYAF